MLAGTREVPSVDDYSRSLNIFGRRGVAWCSRYDAMDYESYEGDMSYSDALAIATPRIVRAAIKEACG